MLPRTTATLTHIPKLAQAEPRAFLASASHFEGLGVIRMSEDRRKAKEERERERMCIIKVE